MTRCRSTVAGDGNDFYIQSSKRKAREEHDLPRKMDVKFVIPGNLLLVVKAREEKEARRNLTPGNKEIY